MITITNASIYSMKGEMAYQIEYSEGTIVRVVESKDKFIRNEYKTAQGWKQSGKPYVVKRNGKRNAEKIKAQVIDLCK